MRIFNMDAKKLSGRLAVVFAGATLISGIALLASGLPGAIRRGEDWPAMKLNPDKDMSFDVLEEYPPDQVTHLRARMSFESIKVVPASGNAVSVRYTGAARGISDVTDVFSMEMDGSTLVLASHWSGVSPVGEFVRLEIGIPEGFSGDIDVRGGSGRLEVSGVSAANINAQIGSGTVRASNLESGGISLRTSSGSVDATDIQAVSLELRTSSGGLRGTNLRAGSISTQSGSGRTVLDGLSGALSARSSSGGVKAAFVEPGDRIDIDVSSGGIDLALPGDSGFELDAKTGSGRIVSDFPVSISGNLNQRSLRGTVGRGGRTVTLRTSSGSIRLEEGS